MKKNVLFRTNLTVCVVIMIGFVITSFISYRSNCGIFRKDVENVSKLTSEGIYHQIDSIFTKPINISLTMANDSLLKDFLEGEQGHLEDQDFINTMRNYLNTYRKKYGYDSVFLASVQTRRYYYYNGLDRILEEGDRENDWFYDFLEQDSDYGIQIDNDQVDGAGNEVTVFINCRIRNQEGGVMGVVGVGFRVDSLQSLLRSYESNFNVNASLVDPEGYVEISTSTTGFEGRQNLFESCPYPKMKDSVLNQGEEPQNLWYSTPKGHGYVVSRYIDNLDWYLIVENDTTELYHQLTMQLARETCIVAVTILLVLVTITTVIRRYNKKIIELTVAREKEHQTVYQQAAEQLYENIHEIDITHNRSASEAAAQYFESLGAPPSMPFDQALQVIAQKQIKEEFRKGYVDTFTPENVLKSYEKGVENLKYDFMITLDGVNYVWKRIIAHIFHWDEDDSIRMLVYRQDIDEEKRYELYMADQVQKDSLTGLYNKMASQEHIRHVLEQDPVGLYAFFIFDIDYFKEINDHFGHIIGDAVLTKFAHVLREQFGKDHIVGRIGGDEFSAFMPAKNQETVRECAQKLLDELGRPIETDKGSLQVTASIGIALTAHERTSFETLYKQADYALYEAKEQGRNRFVITQA